jgi:hypothetical protein
VKRKPPHLPNTFIGWIKPVLMLPEDEIIAVAGLDVLIFIQLLYYGGCSTAVLPALAASLEAFQLQCVVAGFLIFAFCTFWCCALLMPINGTVRGPSSCQTLCTVPQIPFYCSMAAMWSFDTCMHVTTCCNVAAVCLHASCCCTAARTSHTPLPAPLFEAATIRIHLAGNTTQVTYAPTEQRSSFSVCSSLCAVC